MSHRLRAVLYALGVLLVLTLLLITWRATVTAQEDVPAGSILRTEDPTVFEPAAPVPGGPGFYTQNGFAFRPYPSQSTPYSYIGVKLINPDSSSNYYEAPVSLPQGATVTKFVVWYYDNDASQNMWAALALGSLGTNYGSVMAEVDSSGASTDNRYGEDTTITNATIDLQSNSYWVEGRLPPSTSVGIVAFRIDYQYASSLPLIMKK